MSNAENLLQNNQLTEQSKQQRLHRLLDRADIWQTGNDHKRQPGGIPSGYRALDAVLAGHGWPRGATSELLLDKAGIGEVSLLLPVLAEMTQQGRMVILVNPPYIPYAPALATAGVRLEKLLVVHPHGQRDRLWTTEQALQSGACGALINWQNREVPADKDLRRMQIAAREGDCMHFHFRPGSSAPNPSPAALRLKLHSDGEQLTVELLKQLNGKSGQKLHLARSTDLTRRDQPLH